jgi:Ca2+-binding EF-hand superfamily protein
MLDLHHRLQKLFEMTDYDKSGELNGKEFQTCLLKLDIGLSIPEIEVLFTTADDDHSGTISLSEFKAFCTSTLVGIIKEKMKIRAHRRKTAVPTSNDHTLSIDQNARFQANLNDYRDLLKNIYGSVVSTSKIKGFLSFTEFRNALMSLHIDLSPLLMDLMLSEVNPREGQLTAFDDLVHVHSELMHVCRPA